MKLLLSLFFIMSLPAFASLPDSADPIIQSQNTELMEQLNPKQAVISKAVIVQNGQAVCYIDFADSQNQEVLLPPFSKSIPENFRSSISIHNLRACNDIEKENYSYLKDHFVLEGTQTAVIPLIIGIGGPTLAGGGIGCLIGNLTKEDPTPTLIIGGVSLATMISFVPFEAESALRYSFPVAHFTTGAFFGAVMCGMANFNIIHFFENIFD